MEEEEPTKRGTGTFPKDDPGIESVRGKVVTRFCVEHRCSGWSGATCTTPAVSDQDPKLVGGQTLRYCEDYVGQCHKRNCTEQARPDSKFCVEHSCTFELSNGAPCHSLRNGRTRPGDVPSALEQYDIQVDEEEKKKQVWISFDL